MALAAALLCWHASVPPVAQPADAPPARFSAGRAMADVRLIGQAPHPAGSAEHRRVRTRLLARMAALGLAPRVLPGRAIKLKTERAGVSIEGADVANLIGVLRGRDAAAPALLLMAHYDSVPSSSGAADDGAGIAAALEIVRALRTGAPPVRDVVLLFTDAEEDGLLGARAFFADRHARRIGFVLNMDMRGGGGRAIMHETGHGAGGAIALYRRSAPQPTTDSIAAYVERLIRNSSDFRIAADRGLPGLNFAILDRQFDYHAASSRPDTLDSRSLQHLGDQVLGVARAAAVATALPDRARDPAYASLLGIVVIAYPAWIGWIVGAAGLALALAAWRRAAVPAAAVLRATVLRGTAAAVHLLLVLVLALTLARLATGVPFGFTVGRPLLARWDWYEAAVALLGAAVAIGWWGLALAGLRRAAVAVPLVLGGLILLAGGGGWIVAAMAAVAALLAWPAWHAPIPPRALGLGLAAIVALLALVAQAVAPTAAVMPTWSLLGGGAALLLAADGTRRGLALAGVVAAVLVAQQAATAHLLMLAVGETIAAVAAPFLLFAALPLAPLLAASLRVRSAAWVALPPLVLAAGAILLIRFGDPASARRPAIGQIVHVSDGASGRFYRATSLAFPDRWTRAALGPAGQGALLPVYDHALIAPGEPIAPARVRIERGRRADGAVVLRFRGPPGTREIRLALAATAPLRGAQVNGIRVPLLAAAGRLDRVSWVGADPVVTLVLAPRGPGRLVARASALRDGWPADARPLPPRGPATMPWYDSDTAVSLATTSISW